MTIIESLLHCMIDIDILTDSQKRFIISIIDSSILINDVICSVILLLISIIVIVVIFVVFILTFSDFVIVHLRQLRIGRLREIESVFSFTLLIE